MTFPRRLLQLAVAAAFFGVVGCEWEGSGSDDSWNSRYDWVNFSGVYRPLSGNYVVTSYEPPVTGEDALVKGSESIGTGDGVTATFSDGLSGTPVSLGSVSVSDGYETFTDSSGSGTLTGDKGGTGSINYQTGSITVSFFLAPGAGKSVIARYLYLKAGANGAAEPGSHDPIYTLTVTQEGNKLTITDSNGQVYNGQFASVRSTSGDVLETRSGQIVAEFTANSAWGRRIRMVGNFSGSMVAAQPNVLFDRQIQGNYIDEDSGATGDILGGAASIAVNIPQPSYDTRPTATNTTTVTAE
jgi:hypothetical protein